MSVGIQSLVERVGEGASKAGVFSEVVVRDGRLVCRAAASAAPASYRVEEDGGRVWVSLVMADRWLSESIEADLMHTGDKMEELLEEELVDQGFSGGRLPVEHFRSEDLLFTFRSPLPEGPGDLAAPGAASNVLRCLLAYEACFRNLGDMSAGVPE